MRGRCPRCFGVSFNKREDSPLTLSYCWNHLGSADQRAGWLARFQLWVRDTNPAALNHGLPRRELNFTLFRLQSLFFRGSNGHHLQRFITILAQWPTAIPQQLTAILLWCVGSIRPRLSHPKGMHGTPCFTTPSSNARWNLGSIVREWGFHSWQCPASPTRPMTSRPGSTAGAKPNSRSDPPLSKQGMDEPRLQSLCARHLATTVLLEMERGRCHRELVVGATDPDSTQRMAQMAGLVVFIVPRACRSGQSIAQLSSGGAVFALYPPIPALYSWWRVVDMQKHAEATCDGHWIPPEHRGLFIRKKNKSAFAQPGGHMHPAYASRRR